MPEVDKQITFNAFHIYIVSLVINLWMNSNYDYIINFIDYLINVEAQGFWFNVLYMLLVYLMLSHVQIDLGFHAAVNFNL